MRVGRARGIVLSFFARVSKHVFSITDRARMVVGRGGAGGSLALVHIATQRALSTGLRIASACVRACLFFEKGAQGRTARARARAYFLMNKAPGAQGGGGLGGRCSILSVVLPSTARASEHAYSFGKGWVRRVAVGGSPPLVLFRDPALCARGTIRYAGVTYNPVKTPTDPKPSDQIHSKRARLFFNNGSGSRGRDGGHGRGVVFSLATIENPGPSGRRKTWHKCQVDDLKKEFRLLPV